MPNFDGTGPLKRGRVIGWELGLCRTSDGECRRRTDSHSPEPEKVKREYQPE
jgi:hypothetical protein